MSATRGPRTRCGSASAFAGVLLLSGAAASAPVAADGADPVQSEAVLSLRGARPPPLRIAPSRSPELALRLAGWPGTRIPPAADGEAPAPGAEASQPPEFADAPPPPPLPASQVSVSQAPRTEPLVPQALPAAEGDAPAPEAEASQPPEPADAPPPPPLPASQVSVSQAPRTEPLVPQALPAAEGEAPAPEAEASQPPEPADAPPPPPLPASQVSVSQAPRTEPLVPQDPQTPPAADGEAPAPGVEALRPPEPADASAPPPLPASQASVSQAPRTEPLVPQDPPAAEHSEERDGAASAAEPTSTAEPTSAGAPVDARPDDQPPATLTLALGQSRRLHIDRNASAVLAAYPEIADVQLLSPDTLYVIGKGVGRTSVAVLDDDGWIEEWVVSVVLDLDPLRTLLAGEPGLRGVRLRHLSHGVVLTGEAVSAEAADRVLRITTAALPEGVSVENEMRITTPQQVNLEVQIAEVHRSATEHLGINWEAVRRRGSETFGFRIGRAFFDTDENRFTLGLIDGEPTVGFGLLRQTGRTRIGGMIDALATAGLANVLARPNVTAVSGETASFFSGGEYPLPVGFEDGVIIFEYKKYGVLLDFVPTVVDTGRIVLTVRPEVSEPSRSQSVQVVGTDIPVINVRRAETTVEVGDGESIVIAGLFRNTSNTAESGLPGLKDLPALGVLFGRTTVRSDELELIVVVTARLVHDGPAPGGDAGETSASRQVQGYHY